MQATHLCSSPGSKPISPVFMCAVCLLQPAAAIKAINPSAEHDYDWSGCQTINLYLSHSLCCCGSTKYHQMVSMLALAEWNNRVIRQSVFDLGGQLIHLLIRLDYFFWNGYRRQPETFHSFSGDISIFHLRAMPFFSLQDAAFLFCFRPSSLLNPRPLGPDRQEYRNKYIINFKNPLTFRIRGEVIHTTTFT